MEVKIQCLIRNMTKCFGLTREVETLHVSYDSRHRYILSILKAILQRHGEFDGRLPDVFDIICSGKALLSMKDKVLESSYEVLVGHVDTWGLLFFWRGDY